MIYRTILVPANITLRKLHVTLLWAMGWQGGHLHEFIINDMHYGEPDPDYPEHDLKNEQRVRLEKALGGAHTFDYLYDYGDAWWHRVTLLERTQFEGPLDSPWCLDGANACPPEDVGGIPGYEDCPLCRFYLLRVSFDQGVRFPQSHLTVHPLGSTFVRCLGDFLPAVV
ncbi:plasmid pRiA4b ORF-3 family protein [Eoetvoesiella caeni]|uniref:plasmid pRiA4b ORF-3 family protein n=1 Tax=Eoetvoesiella caeni TaxID=645616 RepID=UPI001C551F87